MQISHFDDLSSKDPKAKYACVKNLLIVAREKPAEIYPELDFFVELLENGNKILKWMAIDVIGSLARVDDMNKVDKLMSKLVGLLNATNMITANHAIAALTDVALAKPEYQAEITNELLNIEHYDYETGECQNIAIGKVILAISTYFSELENKEATTEFVKRQTRNTRNATKKKADKFLQQYNLQY